MPEYPLRSELFGSRSPWPWRKYTVFLAPLTTLMMPLVRSCSLSPTTRSVRPLYSNTTVP